MSSSSTQQLTQQLQYWKLAARTPSVLKIWFPIFLGIGAGIAVSGAAGIPYIVLALLYGWFNQLTIIFLNDAADYEADIHHTKAFPTLIDSRVIPNDWLSKRQIFGAGCGTATLMTAVTLVAALWFARPWAPLFAVLSVGFMWVYSFAPVKINYRGHGELLEMIGVGGILPWLGYYFYTGDLHFPVLLAVPMLLLALAGSIASTLKHMPADAQTGKKTVPVKYGLDVAKKTVLVALVAAMGVSVALVVPGVVHPIAIILTSGLPLWFVYQMKRQLPLATHDNLPAMKHFKSALNNATYLIVIGLVFGVVIG